MNKVFLGGTCAESTWRDKVIKSLQVDCFNPVVDDWNEAFQEREEEEKKIHCNIHLYVITKEMIGAFSIAEAVESALTPGKNTILHIIPEGFKDSQLRSFKAICKMIIKHGGVAYIDNDLLRTVRVINYSYSNNGIE